MIDSTKLGEISAKAMEHMDADETLDGGNLLAVALVCIALDRENTQSYTRIFCSDDVYYRQVGIFRAALDAVEYGDPRQYEEDE